MEGEDPLYADSSGDLAYREGLADTAAPTAQAHTLEDLDTLLLALTDAVEDPDRITRSEVGSLVPKLLLLQLIDQV